MVWRYRKSINLGSDVQLNLNKSGIGISADVKGGRIGANSRGLCRSLSIPHTGLYNRGSISINKRTENPKRSTRQEANVRPVSPATIKADPGFPPLPRELAASGSGMVIFSFIVAIFLLVTYWPIGLLALIIAIICVIGQPKNHTRTDFLLARQATTRGDYRAAIDYYIKVLKAKPNLNQVYTELVSCYEAVKDWENAADALNRSPHNPNDVSFLVNYARYLGGANKFGECISVLQSLPAEIKQKLKVIVITASAFLKAGQPALALEVLRERPIRKRIIDGDNILAYFYILGATYKALGDVKRAIRYLSKVSAVKMDYENVKRLITELEGIRESYERPEIANLETEPDPELDWWESHSSERIKKRTTRAYENTWDSA
ncbi:MAG TPA: DUF4236 domain-containing protein [Syntrophomonadaceae bacterium]|nr:DUF4236 domain-containing protein [Syntrophomonadaceae bacterium]